MNSILKYFLQELPGWQGDEDMKSFLIEQCNNWSVEAIQGLAKFMKNENVQDPRDAIERIILELDQEVKPRLM
ncbi:MAG: hypothetical protein AAF587_41595 [Bacteroidota bacterium]